MSVFSDAFDAIIAAPDLAARITYVPRGGEPLELPALVERLDEEADVGGAAIEQHVLSFTFRKADYARQGGRGDIIRYQDRTWYVGEPAMSVEDGGAWTVRAERADDR